MVAAVEIVELIAHGGMGIVYKARHAGLDRVVALKTIRSGILASRKDVERFQREARSAAGATLFLLLAVAIGSPIAAWRITAARNAERSQRERAEASAQELIKNLYAADIRTAWQALADNNLLLVREAVYHDGIVRIWEMASWREVVKFEPNVSFPFGLAFSPDGKLLATGDHPKSRCPLAPLGHPDPRGPRFGRAGPSRFRSLGHRGQW